MIALAWWTCRPMGVTCASMCKQPFKVSHVEAGFHGTDMREPLPPRPMAAVELKAPCLAICRNETHVQAGSACYPCAVYSSSSIESVEESHRQALKDLLVEKLTSLMNDPAEERFYLSNAKLGLDESMEESAGGVGSESGRPRQGDSETGRDGEGGEDGEQREGDEDEGRSQAGGESLIVD